MRDVSRIKKFCDELAKIWEAKCPDWRFGQLMSNILGQYYHETKKDFFFAEEDEMMQFFKKYFEIEEEKN